MKRKYWFFIVFLFYGSRSFLEFPIFILNLSYSNICWIKTAEIKINFFRFVLLYFVIQIWNVENAKISCKKGEKEFPWKKQQKFGWLHESQIDWELCFIQLCTAILRSALSRSAILLCTFLFCSVLPHMKVCNWNTAWIQQKYIYLNV